MALRIFPEDELVLDLLADMSVERASHSRIASRVAVSVSGEPISSDRSRTVYVTCPDMSASRSRTSSSSGKMRSAMC